MMINVDANARNWLTKVCVLKNLFGIVVIESGCDKSCDFGEYLDYENCKCREKIVDKLVEEYTETFEEKKIAKNMHKCDCCILYIALFSIILQLMLKLAFILFIFIGA